MYMVQANRFAIQKVFGSLHAVAAGVWNGLAPLEMKIAKTML